MDDMKDLPAPTTNEIKLIIDNSLLEQERRITDNFRTTIDGLSDKFATREALTNVDKKHESKSAVQDKAIKSLEEWNKWAARLILGVVLTAVVAGVIVTR